MKIFQWIILINYINQIVSTINYDDNEDPVIPNQYIAKLSPFQPPSSNFGIMSVDTTSQIFNPNIIQVGTSQYETINISDMTSMSSLEDNVNYLYVEPVQTFRAMGTPPVSWGLNRIDQPNLPLSLNISYNPLYSGSGVNVYVLDSGVRDTHIEIYGRVKMKQSFVPSQTTNTNDGLGHGTHVAATIAGTECGVAKNASIINVRVLDEKGRTDTNVILKAMKWVIQHAGSKSSVINLSLGGPKSKSINDLVQAASNLGHIVVVAAGNHNWMSGDSCLYSPSSSGGNARESYGVISVGASDNNDTRPFYSNYGSCVDIFAPGDKIYSASNSSDTAYKIDSGTSMAAPHVAGVAAVLLEKHNFNKAAALSELFSTAITNKITNTNNSTNLLLQLTTNTFGLCINQTCTYSYIENTFGVKSSKQTTEKYSIVNETTDLCNSTMTRFDYVNKAIIVGRINCNISKKAAIAKKLGAKLLIVYMMKKNQEPKDSKQILYQNIGIPVFIVSNEFGRYLMNNTDKQVSLENFDPRLMSSSKVLYV